MTPFTPDGVGVGETAKLMRKIALQVCSIVDDVRLIHRENRVAGEFGFGGDVSVAIDRY